MACSVSIEVPSEQSREKVVRTQLEQLRQRVDDMEATSFQIESYTDEMRRTPEDRKRHQQELKDKLHQLQQQHQAFEAELFTWEQNLKRHTEESVE